MKLYVKRASLSTDNGQTTILSIFTVFLTTKTSSQNISITLLQISLKLHEHRGRYWRKKLPWTILEEHFPVPRYTAATKMGNSVISLLWQLRCRCNPDHNNFSSLSNTTVVAIFPKLCLWRRSLCSNLGSIGPEKLYRATLSLVLRKTRIQNQFPLSVFVFIDSLRNCFCFTTCGWLYDFPPKKPRVAFGLPNIVILHWYASGADGRAGGRTGIRSRSNKSLPKISRTHR